MSDSYTKYCEMMEEEELKKLSDPSPKPRTKKKSTKQHTSDRNKDVIEYTRNYVLRHLDKSDGNIAFDVYIVWQCYILGNAKWLISTSLPDGMYYEVTYNKQKDEYYFDAYKKFDNQSFKVSEEM